MTDYAKLLEEYNALKSENSDLRLRLSAIYSLAETIMNNLKIGFGNLERVKHIMSLASARAKNVSNPDEQQGTNARIKTGAGETGQS